MRHGTARFLLLLATASAAALAAPAARAADQALIEHGKYLATAGDCAACHTASGGQHLPAG